MNFSVLDIIKCVLHVLCVSDTWIHVCSLTCKLCDIRGQMGLRFWRGKVFKFHKCMHSVMSVQRLVRTHGQGCFSLLCISIFKYKKKYEYSLSHIINIEVFKGPYIIEVSKFLTLKHAWIHYLSTETSLPYL